MLIVDAHEDIAWNIQTFGRDYTHSVQWLRDKELDSTTPAYNGNTLLSKQEWLAGQVAVIFATVFLSPVRHRQGGWDTQSYSDQREAFRLAQRQIDSYRDLIEREPAFQLIAAASDLASVINSWTDEGEHKIGLVLLIEGADCILEPEQVAEWYAQGVRIVGPAWEATRYAGGTHEPGPLTADGRRLLREMAQMNMILDLSHLAEVAYYQAVGSYEGTLIASHANPRRFLPTSRGLSDEMIQRLAERDGVIGIVPYNAFLQPGWTKGDLRENVPLAILVDAIDHICQLTGSATHVGIGSDFDGGFGLEHTPKEINSVADLAQIEDLLHQRDYAPEQISAILSGNWLRKLGACLP